MKKKYLWLLTIVIVLVIFISDQNKIKTDAIKDNIFTTEKINIDTDVNSKIKNSISQLCKDNGVFLFNSDENNKTYLIFDGTHVNLNGEAPYFSDVKFETKEDMIMIYVSKELKNYSFGEYPEQKLVYKITKDKNYEYIKLFKNGEETPFDSIGG